jgi:integrase
MLTELRCKAAKPADKPYKLTDEKGLYLYVTPTGFKSWRWKFRIGKTEKRMTFGPYPEVSLAQARKQRDEAARVKRDGADPVAERQRAKAAIEAATENTFETVAKRWHETRKATWAVRHAKQVLASLEAEVFAATSKAGLWAGKFGKLPISTITAPMVLAVLRPVESRGAVEQTHRVRQRMSDVFVFAIAAGLAENDPAAIVRKALAPIRKRRFPAFRTLDDARAALKVMEPEPAHPITKLASRLLALTAVRSGPLRHAAPSEFEGLDTPQAQWRIPAEKMKLQLAEREDEAFEFIVPLSRQAVEVVKAALRLVGEDAPLLFPSTRHLHRPMSENAISSMYKRFPTVRGRHVPHGWRSTFSTIMNELAVEEDRGDERAIIDLMLAHKPEGVEGIYNRAAYMPRRRRIAQAWADMLLDGLPPAEQLLTGRRK